MLTRKAVDIAVALFKRVRYFLTGQLNAAKLETNFVYCKRCLVLYSYSIRYC
jgi:hypothetical protein